MIAISLRQQQSHDLRRQHGQQIYDPSRVLIGPDAQNQSYQRTRQDWRADQQSELGFCQAQIQLDLDAYDRKNRPDSKASRECDS